MTLQGRRRVVASINDADLMRCVDILAEGCGFAWVECRRDPEDTSGWHYTGAGESGFRTESAARAAAAVYCPWVEA